MRYKINDIWDFTQSFRYLPSSILQFWNLKANTFVTEWEIWLCLLAESVIIPGLLPIVFWLSKSLYQASNCSTGQVIYKPFLDLAYLQIYSGTICNFFLYFQVSVNVLSFFHNLKNKKEKKLFVTYANGNMI